MPKYTAYARITIPYLIDIDARNVHKAADIAEEQPYWKWMMDPEEPIDDYEIDIIAVQPRREIK